MATLDVSKPVPTPISLVPMLKCEFFHGSHEWYAKVPVGEAVAVHQNPTFAAVQFAQAQGIVPAPVFPPMGLTLPVARRILLARV